MLEAALDALVILSDPSRLAFLFGGVLIGLFLGLIPGLGGIVGLALLLPFTFGMDPYAAFAMLIGMQSVTTTSDTIPAVLFGVPGTSGSAATVLDGHPMAKQGQAGRAFGAAFSASMMGGIFGALMLALAIPILRPVMLYLGSPELLSFSILGLSMVAVLSGAAPLRGLIAACFGLLLSFIGTDPQTGSFRWTGEAEYLWEGLPLVPISLGIFALPELADMAIARRSIAGKDAAGSHGGQWEGVKDTFRHWWLVVRVATIGSGLGAIPGIGAPIVDWIAYGHGARTEKGGGQTFGKGDVRGVISSEGANNAKEGGSLVPTIAFGVPGSASMALLLGAFLIHGFTPGPDMLTKNLDATYTMVWSVALANVLGAGICFGFARQLARLAAVRHSILLPLVIVVVFVGAYQATRQWGDIYSLLFFGVLGWTMKRLSWPRPPLILGVVLGDIVERYLFVSFDLYGADWLFRPVVALVLAFSIWGMLRPFLRELNRTRYCGQGFRAPKVDIQTVFTLAALAGIAALIVNSGEWEPDAKIAPLSVAYFALGAGLLSVINYSMRTAWRKPQVRAGAGAEMGAATEAATEANTDAGMHMDSRQDPDDALSPRATGRRALAFLGWMLGYLLLGACIGLLPAGFLFIVAYMRTEGREPWTLAIPLAAAFTLAAWGLFDRLLSLPWPPSLLGEWLPALVDVIPSV